MLPILPKISAKNEVAAVAISSHVDTSFWWKICWISQFLANPLNDLIKEKLGALVTFSNPTALEGKIHLTSLGIFKELQFLLRQL